MLLVDLSEQGILQNVINVRLFLEWKGVGKKGMAAYLSDAIKDHALDFIGFVEAMKKKYT
jgi:hypothetical protein